MRVFENKTSHTILIMLIVFLFYNLTKGQGLPTRGNAKILIIYSEIEDSVKFKFQPNELSVKLENFYSSMSMNKLQLDITNLHIKIDEPQELNNYSEAILHILEKANQIIDFSEYSDFDNKDVLDGICIVFDNFYDRWSNNPFWSGIAVIMSEDQSQKFDGKEIKSSLEPRESSGIVMRAANSLNYSFWVLAHELGHLLGLTHFPENKQIPYHQLMNSGGKYWNINRGMSFWEREKLGWIQPIIKLDLTDYKFGVDSISFSLEDYMSTGEFAKILLPPNEYVKNEKVLLENERALYFENRMKISEYDQDENKGDEGIFIWTSPGKLVNENEDINYSEYPSKVSYGAPNFFSTEKSIFHNYQKIKDFFPDKGYYVQDYSLPITIKISENNQINIYYGTAISGKSKYISTSSRQQKTIELNDVYPNPFNHTTNISFHLFRKSKVHLEVFNTLGQRVKNLANGFFNAGQYNFSFNASNLPSGIYFYRVMTPSVDIQNSSREYQTKQMIYIK